MESTFEWGSRSATMTMISLSVSEQVSPLACLLADVFAQHLGADHKVVALLTVVGAVGVFIYLLQKCIPRDPRESGKEYHGRPRLD